jgi:hypothetical protein
LNQDSIKSTVYPDSEQDRKNDKKQKKVKKFRFRSAGYYLWGLEASSVVWNFFLEAKE